MRATPSERDDHLPFRPRIAHLFEFFPSAPTSSNPKDESELMVTDSNTPSETAATTTVLSPETRALLKLPPNCHDIYHTPPSHPQCVHR